MSERQPTFGQTWLGVMSGVGVGVLVGSVWYGAVESIGNGDSDPGTYELSDLTVVEFSPETGVECRGLSPSGVEQVLAVTIVCDWSSVEPLRP